MYLKKKKKKIYTANREKSSKDFTENHLRTTC